jgi:hypothetical protein
MAVSIPELGRRAICSASRSRTIEKRLANLAFVDGWRIA